MGTQLKSRGRQLKSGSRKLKRSRAGQQYCFPIRIYNKQALEFLYIRDDPGLLCGTNKKKSLLLLLM